MRFLRVLACGVVLIAGARFASQCRAQSFGVELHNTLMPASGGMAGTSLAMPQDLQSAIYGNPATLTQYSGTQFSFGGAWVEPTYNVEQLTPLPAIGVDPYSAKSGLVGSATPNIGVTQDLSELGLPATFGIGLFSNAGAGVDFRDVPESNGTSADYLALDIVFAAGMDLTDRLSLGAAFTLGNSYLDGPFVDLGGMTPAYGIRGTVGLNYEVGCDTTLGLYYQTKKAFQFDNAVLIGGQVFDVHMDHPENFGFGVANKSLMDGRLLLAVDVLYNRYGDADFYQAIWTDQWVFQTGAQYSLNRRTRLRLGYAYAQDCMRDNVGVSAGGVPFPAVTYIQSQFAAINPHRLTAGVGTRDVLPGIDLDLFAGGMFENTEQFGTTIASVQSYWVGAGLTWRFGRGCCERLPVPDSWSE